MEQQQQQRAPSDSSMTSSNRSKVSGAGWSSAMSTVASCMCTKLRMQRVMRYVVLLSRPVEISSWGAS